MPNMVTVMLDGLLVGVHNADTPSASEWAAYLSTCQQMVLREEREGAPCRQLILTSGGGPSLEQRRAAHRLLPGRAGRVAVVSESGFVRFAVKALTLTNPLIRVFAPARMDEALGYLGVPALGPTLALRIADLRAQLTWPTPRDASKSKRRRGPAARP